MVHFIPGLKLSRLFYQEAVRPVMEHDFPGLCYSAALIGSGSEVFGFDTEMSTDHDWGPRLLLFLEKEDLNTYGIRITAVLGEKLPFQFHGWPTGFDLHENGSGVLKSREVRPVPHRVRVHSLESYFTAQLGWDTHKELTPADWLSIPQQDLRAVTAGEVFHDEVGLEDIRRRLVYYPRDTWLYLLACQWQRIGQEEHLAGRAGQAGDDLGSWLIASRLVRDLMYLGFFMEKVYAPYPKWFGTAFRQLHCSREFLPVFERVQRAGGWQERLAALAEAYEIAASYHNQLGITTPLPDRASQFYERPFPVIWGSQFAQSLLEQIQDEAVLSIAAKGLPGSIDQISDNTDFAGSAAWREWLKKSYQGKI